MWIADAKSEAVGWTIARKPASAELKAPWVSFKPLVREP